MKALRALHAVFSAAFVVVGLIIAIGVGIGAAFVVIASLIQLFEILFGTIGCLP